MFPIDSRRTNQKPNKREGNSKLNLSARNLGIQLPCCADHIQCTHTHTIPNTCRAGKVRLRMFFFYLKINYSQQASKKSEGTQQRQTLPKVILFFCSFASSLFKRIMDSEHDLSTSDSFFIHSFIPSISSLTSQLIIYTQN